MLLNGSLGKTLQIPTPGRSALHALKHFHEQLMQHCNCKEWAPPPSANAPAPGTPAPELDDNARPLSLPPINLIASLRVRQDEENGDANARPSLPLQRQVTKQIMRKWGRHENARRNPPTDRVIYTNSLSPNPCPCLTRTQHFAPICLSATTTRAGSQVSPSHLPRPYRARWGVLGLPVTAMLAPLRPSRRRIMLPSSITFSDSPTILHSLLSRM